MSDINEFHKNSSLSFAAYADLFKGIGTAAYIDALQQVQMPQSQAENFVAHWEVIDRYTDATGVSATVFEKVGGGQRYLAIRGTESPGDIGADYILARGFPPEMNPQFVGLKSAVQDWIDNGTLSADFSITGHSLGGYLAVALGSSFEEAGEVYTYNAPGFGGVAGNIEDAIRDVFGLGDSPLVADVTNIRGTGSISVASKLGQQPAPPTFIVTESSSNPLDNHGIAGLSDALAVYSLYGDLDPSLEASEVMDIFKASRRNNGVSLESTLDALREIVLGDDIAPTSGGDREQFYENYFLLKESDPYAELVGKADIDVLTGESATSLAEQARTDAALRYALDHGHVMVLRNDLPIYQGESNAPERFSEQYLLDRARYVVNVGDNQWGQSRLI